MRAALFAIALAFAAAAAAAPPITLSGDPISVSVKTIEHFQYRGTDTRFDGVEFRGGLVVSSTENSFGGLSGIVVLPGGRDVFLVSDLGDLMQGRLEYDGSRLSGLTIQHMRRALPGEVKRTRRNDSEDLVIGTNGNLFIALEGENEQIAELRLAGNGMIEPTFVTLPGAGKMLGMNKGIESLELFPAGSEYAGRLLAIGERPRQRTSQHIPCWIVDVGTCSIKRRDGFSITSARFLPDGDLLILERKLAPGFDLEMRLRRIPARQIGVGKVMDGETVMRADLSKQIDNMEGLAVHQDDDGQTVLTLISDDNRAFFQRTLILQFTLIDQKPG